MEEEYCKIVLVGDSNTGKSSLIYRLIHNKFLRDSIPTIGISYNLKIIKQKDKELNLIIWDTAGSERYHSLSRLYYRDADFVFLCFDVSEIQTFINLPMWLGNIKDNCSNKDVSVYLLGNKCDIKKFVSTEKIDIFCEKYNVKFFETSSKDNIKINNLLDSVFIEYHEKLEEKNKNKVINKNREIIEVNADENTRKYICW